MRALVVATVAALVAPTPALADPDDLVTRPLVLGAGELDARLTVEANLQKARYARPLSVAPDVWLGVTPRWTVGLVHSSNSVDRIDAGASFCVRELASDCDRRYRGSGLDVRWSARAGALAIAPRVRLLIRDLDPVKPAITLGAQLRWTRGRYLIATDPYLRLGLANRDLGNRTALSVPLWLGLQPGCRWLLALHTGWEGDLAVWRDGWHGPFGLVVQAAATAHLDLGLELGFASLIGPQNNIKQRAVMATVGWRGTAW